MWSLVLFAPPFESRAENARQEPKAYSGMELVTGERLERLVGTIK
jgi:hypothetical protein